MARYNKFQVMATIAEAPMIPVFYNKDVDICKNVIKACYQGGVRAFEFTNRGDFAHEVFGELAKWATKECPDLALGVGSVVDVEGKTVSQRGLEVILGRELSLCLFDLSGECHILIKCLAGLLEITVAE